MTKTRTSESLSQTTDEDAPKVLTREIGLAERIAPNGRKAQIISKNNLWSFRLEGVGAQPLETGIWYTGRHRAEDAMYEYLTKFWNMSDSKKAK